MNNFWFAEGIPDNTLEDLMEKLPWASFKADTHPPSRQ
jgi:hypothetical protein